MFVPLHDDTPLRLIRFQFVTGLLIALNLAVFLLTGAFTGEAQLAATADSLGVVPRELFGGAPPPGVSSIPEPLTLVTYEFLHAGWLHLIGNLLFLWVFADNIEDAFGHVGFLIFYVLTGAAAALLHSLLEPSSPVPLVGASGAVSGVLAAYLVLFPRARVWILLFMRIPVRIPALFVLGGWFLLQVYSLFAAGADDAQVAFGAHLGGFLAGLAITLMARPWLRANLRA